MKRCSFSVPESELCNSQRSDEFDENVQDRRLLLFLGNSKTIKQLRDTGACNCHNTTVYTCKIYHVL